MLKMRRGAVVAEMKTSARFCGVPFYRKAWKAIVCHFCGAVLKSSSFKFLASPRTLLALA
ncbi:unnamed protein product [Brassica oleracea]